ncbi:S41 family peptidase [Tenacibaculum aiptasiae]|uniref:S41 family peptidase n=1 Tax=Tenacibaculum aiptasiae TaxID=426481 RepID=UPI003B5997AE
MKTCLNIMYLSLLLFFSLNVKAQKKKNTLTEEVRKEIIKSIQENLLESYVDLELSYKMIAELSKNIKAKKYSQIINPFVFSRTLTEDLQNISKDYHLKVRFEPKRIAQKKLMVSEGMQQEIQRRKMMKMREINYGFKELKILNGNIGYLNLQLFADTKHSKNIVNSAMTFLNNTNAMIIDLRNNRGGVPSMMQLLSSYFFDKKPVLLSNFYERKNNTKTQLYSLTNLKGNRYKKPVYVLTSKNTFSAAEAFTYTLKYLGKVTVVGEVTKGGANRTKRINLNDEFTISVPYIKPIHPKTKTNWEGVGVIPNIKTTKKDAFVKAYIEAINQTVKKKKNSILNNIGYTFLQERLIDEALIVFQENTKLFSNDANAWDSLGEAYFMKQDKENALKSYEKALELDPSLVSAQKMIQKLENLK